MRITEILLETAPAITTAYHITTISNAESILEVGLQPQNDEQHSFYTEGKRTYLIVNPKDIPQVRGWLEAKLDASGNYDEPLTLLQVNVAGIPLNYESGWYYATIVIPPERITDLGERALSKY